VRDRETSKKKALAVVEVAQNKWGNASKFRFVHTHTTCYIAYDRYICVGKFINNLFTMKYSVCVDAQRTYSMRKKYLRHSTIFEHKRLDLLYFHNTYLVLLYF